MQATEPALQIAATLADTLGGIGYAFVEDENIEEFAKALNSFFVTQGIRTYRARAAEYFREVEELRGGPG
jgi:hypothetical protein